MVYYFCGIIDMILMNARNISLASLKRLVKRSFTKQRTGISVGATFSAMSRGNTREDVVADLLPLPHRVLGSPVNQALSVRLLGWFQERKEAFSMS